MHNIIPITKKRAIEVIDEIKNIDLKVTEIDEIKNLIKELITGLVHITPQFHPGLKLYRGIKYKEKPQNVSFLSYPPEHKITSYQRINRIGKPMFYAAAARTVPFFELDANVGDTLVLSKWISKENILLNNIGYTSLVSAKLNSNRNTPNWNKNSKRDDVSEVNDYILNFLSEEFTKVIKPNEDFLYKISVAIAEKFYQSEIFDGILYPFISMNANADNIALKPKAIDENKLHLEYVEFIEVLDKRGMKYEINVLDFTNSFEIHGEINWKGRKKRWSIPSHIPFQQLNENGEEIIRDMNGNEILPE